MTDSNTNAAAPAVMTKEERDRRTAALDAVKAAAAKPAQPPRNLPAPPATPNRAQLGAQSAEDKALQARQKHILSHYKPNVKTQAEAEAAIIGAMRDVASVETEAAVSTVAKLGVAFQPELYFLLHDMPGKPAIKADASLVAATIKRLREFAGDNVNAKVVRLDPKTKQSVEFNTPAVALWETVSRHTLECGIKAAALLVYSDVTKVRLGYTQAEKLPGNNVIGDFVWSPSDVAAKHAAICLPHNVLAPVTYGGSGGPEVDGMYRGGFATKNVDTDLYALNREQIGILFAHYFAGEKLVYEEYVEKKGDTPSGRITKPAASRAPNSGTGSAGPDLAAMVAALPSSGGPEALCATLAAILAKPCPQWGSPSPLNLVGMLANLAEAAISATRREGLCLGEKFGESKTAAALVSLRNALCELVEDEDVKTGNHHVVTTAGRKPITGNDPVLLPGTVTPNTAAAAVA